MDCWHIMYSIFSVVMSLMVAYMFVYVAIGLFKKKKFKETENEHTYGFLIAGRNEEKVIGQLIDSIRKNNYNQDKIKIFVCADNCDENDKTAVIAREMGAVVYERQDRTKIGKSYALDFLLKNIAKDYPDYQPDGFFVFDADNLLDKNYIKEMNKAFDSGEEIITSYRASKNYGDSLFSMGSSVHFIRSSRFLHTPRVVLGLSTTVQGTGFLASIKIINPKKGWNYGKLTEDVEFSCDNVLSGRKISYCDDAVFFDEQPTTWKQTYRQRLRWQKGIYQCFGTFAINLLGLFCATLNFTYYDFFAYYAPLPVFSTTWAMINGVFAIIEGIFAILNGNNILIVLSLLALALFKYLLVMYFGLFVYGSLAVLRDWKRIKAPRGKKLLSMFAYPIFMITIIPICFIAIFKKVEWQPIAHNAAVSIDEVAQNK